MTVGARLKEERQRLGLSQERFAAIAGVAKNTAINWEKDASSPTAQALVAWSEAGADALYILIGRPTPDRPDDIAARIEDQLTVMKRDILAPAPNDAEVVPALAEDMRYILEHHGAQLPVNLREEVESWQDILNDPRKLDMFRAADFAQMKRRRDEARRQLRAMLTGPYCPGDGVVQSLADLALDHSVPITRLVLLAEDMHGDITSKSVGER